MKAVTQPAFVTGLLAGRVAFVTGASSGIGRHIAALLAGHGATVVVAARRVPELEALVLEIAAAGGQAHAVALDVRDPAMVERAMGVAVAEVGPPDIVVNNSGVAVTRLATQTSEEDWQRVLDTNLSGAFRVAREAAKALIGAGRGGTILNIASVAGLRAARGIPAYVASKAGLIRLTEALALELAPHGIRVNALAPGYIETELNRDFLRSPSGASIAKRIPLHRFGVPGDLDGALLLLVSDAGAYITGSTLTVDGGHSVSWL